MIWLCNPLLEMKLKNDELQRIFERNKSLAARNAHLAGVAPNAVHQPSAVNQSLGKTKRKGGYSGRRLVRFTSKRVRLIDERNLEDKYFTDALRYAGLLFEDSPQFVKVEVIQEKVSHKHEECTIIEIERHMESE